MHNLPLFSFNRSQGHANILEKLVQMISTKLTWHIGLLLIDHIRTLSFAIADGASPGRYDVSCSMSFDFLVIFNDRSLQAHERRFLIVLLVWNVG